MSGGERKGDNGGTGAFWDGVRINICLLKGERERSIGKKKTCRKKQHVGIDDMNEMPNLICGKAAVGGNYNLMRDNCPV